MSEIKYNEKSVSRFQAMIRKKTVSSKDGNFDKEEFASFLPMLKELYPTVFEKVQAQLINEYGILVKWPGKDSKQKPVVLMAHYDVVSDEGQQWQYPAFEAEIHDGCVWGRGTIDTKCLIAGIFEAMEKLIDEGFEPERDIYFASSNCEEIGGDTMPKIVEYFKENEISPWFVLDEGGAIMSNLPMGIKTPFAMVAVSEKGWANIKLTATGKNAAHGAKASKTKSLSATQKILEAVAKMEKAPMPAVITPALEGMLKSFAPYVSAPLDKILKNAGMLKPALKKVMQSNADTAAMIRSVFILSGIDAVPVNGVAPETASAFYKVRIAPHDNFDSIMEHIKNTVGEDIEVTAENVSPAPPISDHETKAFCYIKGTVNKVFPDVGVSPFILNAGTDSRHFAAICPQVYRFGAFRLNDELFSTVHSANERMPIKDYMKCIEFYTELIRNLY